MALRYDTIRNTRTRYEAKQNTSQSIVKGIYCEVGETPRRIDREIEREYCNMVDTSSIFVTDCLTTENKNYHLSNSIVRDRDEHIINPTTAIDKTPNDEQNEAAMSSKVEVLEERQMGMSSDEGHQQQRAKNENNDVQNVMDDAKIVADEKKENGRLLVDEDTIKVNNDEEEGTDNKDNGNEENSSVGMKNTDHQVERSSSVEEEEKVHENQSTMHERMKEDINTKSSVEEEPVLTQEKSEQNVDTVRDTDIEKHTTIDNCETYQSSFITPTSATVTTEFAYFDSRDDQVEEKIDHETIDVQDDHHTLDNSSNKEMLEELNPFQRQLERQKKLKQEKLQQEQRKEIQKQTKTNAETQSEPERQSQKPQSQQKKPKSQRKSFPLGRSWASPPAVIHHVDYKSKAEERKAELEALRRRSLAKPQMARLQTAEAPSELGAEFLEKQRELYLKQRKEHENAIKSLHEYRADDQLLLRQKSELEALQKLNLTKPQVARLLASGDAPTAYSIFLEQQKEFFQEQEKNHRDAIELLHRYRADDQSILLSSQQGKSAKSRSLGCSPATTPSKMMLPADVTATSTTTFSSSSVIHFDMTKIMSNNNKNDDDDKTSHTSGLLGSSNVNTTNDVSLTSNNQEEMITSNPSSTKIAVAENQAQDQRLQQEEQEQNHQSTGYAWTEQLRENYNVDNDLQQKERSSRQSNESPSGDLALDKNLNNEQVTSKEDYYEDDAGKKKSAAGGKHLPIEATSDQVQQSLVPKIMKEQRHHQDTTTSSLDTTTIMDDEKNDTEQHVSIKIHGSLTDQLKEHFLVPSSSPSPSSLILPPPSGNNRNVDVDRNSVITANGHDKMVPPSTRTTRKMTTSRRRTAPRPTPARTTRSTSNRNKEESSSSSSTTSPFMSIFSYSGVFATRHFYSR